MKNKENIIGFTKLKLPHGWMSNLAEYPIEFDGRTFPTSEHLFMFLRLDEHTAKPIRGKLMSIKRAYDAKKYVKAEILKNPSILKHKLQSVEDFELMWKVVGLKLKQHPELVELLLATGDAHIYEDVTKRSNPQSSALYWGAAEVCRDLENIDSFWVGKNVLGRILMTWRNCYNEQINNKS